MATDEIEPQPLVKTVKIKRFGRSTTLYVEVPKEIVKSHSISEGQMAEVYSHESQGVPVVQYRLRRA